MIRVWSLGRNLGCFCYHSSIRVKGFSTSMKAGLDWVILEEWHGSTRTYLLPSQQWKCSLALPSLRLSTTMEIASSHFFRQIRITGLCSCSSPNWQRPSILTVLVGERTPLCNLTAPHITNLKKQSFFFKSLVCPTASVPHTPTTEQQPSSYFLCWSLVTLTQLGYFCPKVSIKSDLYCCRVL